MKGMYTKWNEENKHVIIRLYFKLGLLYVEILSWLSTIDEIDISMRTLSRTVRCMGLNRRHDFDTIDAALFLIDHQDGAEGFK